MHKIFNVTINAILLIVKQIKEFENHILHRFSFNSIIHQECLVGTITTHCLNNVMEIFVKSC